ncbi:MAG: RsmE family RNA methyltransferase [Candidatus Aminicenantes bacterium]|nr:RsmE family RNA methyltransferase [Candidatus Aminicenantes bacterium]
MTANLFFLEKARLSGAECLLEGPEHHHLGRVARLRPGDEVWLFDEEGGKVKALVEEVGPERTRLKLGLRLAPGSSGPRVSLVQSLLKNKAMDEVVSGAVEWGVAAILTVLAERSVVRLEDGGGRKLDRWRQVALAAAKQCKSGRLPAFEPPVPLASFLAGDRAGRKVVLTEHGGRPFKDVIAAAAVLPASADDAWLVLIGPEGGFSEGEVGSIVAAGYEPVSLGANILRAETAALSAVAILIHAGSF